MSERTLHTGDRGADVTAVQRALNRRAAARGYPPLVVDGRVGPQTVWAYHDLGYAIGLLPETLRAGITPDAQRLLIDPDQRVAAQLERERRRVSALARRTVALDGTPVFWGLARPLLRARARGWDGRLTSADRRQGVAERYGKMSQAALYRCFRSRQQTGVCRCASCNPANPPGRSSHELRSDASAFPGPVGRRLVWWELGLDTSDTPELMTLLRRLGYGVRRPYSSRSEAHHINFTRSPGPVIRLGRPPEREPAPPATAAVHGPDISSYQGDVDWDKVRAAGHIFAFIRATVGASAEDTDSRFGSRRLRAMSEAGMVRGFYHVGYPSGGDALTEARHAVATVRKAGGLVAGDLPLVLDLEKTSLSPTATARWASSFCREVDRLTGRGCILYTYPSFWRSRAGDPAKPPAQGAVLWIAHYGVSRPSVPRAWSGHGWSFWQYTDRGGVPGIKGPVDLNHFHGSPEALDRLRLT